MMIDLDHEEIVGSSAHGHSIRRFVEGAARGGNPVLLLGEPGVGKELAARQIHQESSRAEQPLLIVDCSLYYERELKRELFGYKGVGPAAKSRKGLLEFANKGTCYLSSVEELSPALQQSLLQFLREGFFSRLGDQRRIHSGARLIVSSDKNLAGFVEGGLFDTELFDALSTLALRIEPLRERASDVRDIVDAFRRAYCTAREIEDRDFTLDALEALECFPWPGNIDELKKEVFRILETNVDRVTTEQLSLEIASYWIGRRGDPEVRKVLEELDGYIREFRVLSRLDAEFGDVLLSTSDWDLNIPHESRKLGEHLF